MTNSQRTLRSRFLGLAYVSLFFSPVFAQVQLPPPPHGGVTPPKTAKNYPLVDNIRGTRVTTNAAPVRPMVVDSIGNVIWAVNTDFSTVERFTPAGNLPTDTIPVPWGPVSITRWLHPDDGVELLVVCRNSWGLLRIDEATLTPKAWIELRAEPSDIVVDGEDRAFVSCMGADSVARIELLTGAVSYYDEEEYPLFRMKSPYFLSIDGEDIIVAPLHSGNNTTVKETRSFGAFGGTGAGLPPLPNTSEAVVRAGTGVGNQPLPDEDLFRIILGKLNPATNEVDPDEVEVMATGVGTLLFAHGRNPNPTNTRYWVLNTEAENTKAQSEAGLNFDFVANRATLLEGATSPDFVGFDDGDQRPPSGSLFVKGQPSVGNVVGQPFSLLFHPSQDRVLVSGLLTDNVVMLNGNGELIHEIDLAPGSIPRGLATWGSNNRFLFVYCWGTSTIEVHFFNPAFTSSSLFKTLTMTNPNPTNLASGRELFFDGHLSEQTNVSCASCHVDAGSDFLLWNLAGKPIDDKGPMVTQTLVGLERVTPFHWRGERTLEDFNQRAFPGLLGVQELSSGQFADFKSWLFSLRNPANPNQNRDRRVHAQSTSSVIPPQIASNLSNTFTNRAFQGVAALDLNGGSGTRGLTSFQTEPFFERRFACVDCHGFPMGTNNDVVSSVAGDLFPERTHFKVTPFHEIWRKSQSLVVIDDDPDPGVTRLAVRSFLGAGTSHTGIFLDIVRFAQEAILNGGVQLDMAAFIQQWDQGLAPAAHFAYLLTQASSPEEVTSELEDFLLGQATKENCDIAVQGVSNGVRAAWSLDRTKAVPPYTRNSPIFVVDANEGTDLEDTRSLQNFIDEPEPALFIGLPVGMSERFAVDADMDLQRNRSDTGGILAISPGPDILLQNPQVTRAEVEWVTTNTARVVIETDGPTTLEGTYAVSGDLTVHDIESDQLSRVHNLMLTGLRPSTPGPEDNVLILPGDPIPRDIVTFSIDYTVTDVWGKTFRDPNFTPMEPTGFFTLPETELGVAPFVSSFTQMRNEHVLNTPPVVNVIAGGALQGPTVEVFLTTQLKQGSFGSAPIGAANRVFAVRIFKTTPSGPQIVPMSQITVGAGTLVGTDLEGEYPGAIIPDNLVLLEGGGPVLVNSILTGSNGTVGTTGAPTLTFDLASPLFAGEDLIVDVEAVVEVSSVPTNVAGKIRLVMLSQNGFAQWDFPRTTEANTNNGD